MLLMLALLLGCGEETDTDPGEETFPYFRDEDGDGWGEPSDPGIIAPEGGDATHPVRNRMDCDDADERVTGETGDVCPGDFVGEAGAYAGVVFDQTEIFYVYGASPAIEAAPAHQGCLGWGGKLLTLDDATEWANLEQEIQRVNPAGGTYYVGIDRTGGSWAWSDDSSMEIGAGELPWCAEQAPTTGLRVALVITTAGVCLDAPGEAWLICERSAPDPGIYVEY